MGASYSQLVRTQVTISTCDWHQHSLFPIVPAYGGVCHKGPWSRRTFVISTFVVLLVLEKFHSSSGCLVSWIGRFMTGSVSYSRKKWETSFHDTVLTTCVNEGLYFLKLTVE